jgi:hypothetical protein
MEDFASRIRALQAGQMIKEGDEAPPAALVKSETPTDVVQGGTNASFAERIRQAQQMRESGVHTTPVGEIDNADRESVLKTGLAQQGFKTDQLGEPGLGGISDPGGLLVRADLGMSDTFDEKRTKFKAKFPQGDFILVDEPAVAAGRTPTGRGGTTIMFRRHQDEPFSELDSKSLLDFELLGDVADISGDVPAMAIQAIITRGGSLAKQALQTALGQVSGDTAKEIIEHLRGYQKETAGQVAWRIGGNTAAAAAGSYGSTVVTGPLNAWNGRPMVKLLPGASEAMDAAKELGIKPLLPNQVAASPVLRRLGEQSRAAVVTIGQYMREQQSDAVRALSRLRDPYALGIVALDHIEEIHNQAVTQLKAGAKIAVRSLGEGGAALKQGIKEYEELSGLMVDRLYAEARSVDTPDFDIAPLKAVAREVKVGKIMTGKPQAKDTGLIDASGNPITREVQGAVELEKLHPDVAAVIKQIDELDPSLPTTVQPDGSELTSTDGLLTIRRNLFRLKDSLNNPMATPDQKLSGQQAATLYSAINHVLNNPKNADEGFKTAWRRAQDAAKLRFGTLENQTVVALSQAENLTEFAARLANPLKRESVEMLKEIVPAEKFRIFQESVKTHFTADNKLGGLVKRLDDFDKETLDALLSKGDQADLRKLGLEYGKLEQAGIKDVIERQVNVRSAVRDLVERKDTRGLDEFLKRVERLPPDAPARKVVRAAILEDIFERTVGVSQQGVHLVPKTLADEIERLSDTGLLTRALNQQDRRVIAKFKDLAVFLAHSEDSGTSLMAASMVSHLRQGSIKGLRTLMEAVGTGRFLTNPTAQRLLLGKRGVALPYNNYRVMGAIIGAEAADLARGYEEQE